MVIFLSPTRDGYGEGDTIEEAFNEAVKDLEK
jgi:hypothetical protein